MNMRNLFATVAVASTITVGLPAISRAQDDGGEPFASADDQLADKFAREAEKQAAIGARAAFEAKKDVELKFQHFFPGGPGFPAPDNRIREAAAKVRDAKDEAARAAALTQLNSQLDQYFEQDMQAGNKELQNIEARLQKLRAQLDRRRQKKSEIIDLQAKVAINEAEGLGFYGQPKGDKTFNFPVPVPVPIISTSNGELLIQSPPSADAPIPTAAP